MMGFASRTFVPRTPGSAAEPAPDAGDLGATFAERVLERYPSLAGLPRDRLAADLEGARRLSVPARTVLFEGDAPCPGFPFVLAGSVRVSRRSAEGRELELYRVRAGEICIVSAGCLLGSMTLTALGRTLQPTELILLDRETLLAWTDAPPFRTWLLGLMSDRLAELMELVEAVAFRRLDQRLACALLGHGRMVRATHQSLADALGTSREIVSRLLKRFERQGLIRLGREQIEVVDVAGLRGATGE